MSSCLLPQNDDPLPVIPPAKNQPPRIITPLPERYFTVPIGTNCKPPDVKAGVEDADVLDRIRTKWAVYRENGTLDRPFIDGATLLPGATPTARRTSVSPPQAVFDTGALSTTGKGRQLVLIVSDGEFVIEGEQIVSLPVGEERLPDAGFMENPSFIDTYSWVVDSVAQGPCQ